MDGPTVRSLGSVPSVGATGLSHATGSRGTREPRGTLSSMKCVVACSIIVQLKRYPRALRGNSRPDTSGMRAGSPSWTSRVRARVRGRGRVRAAWHPWAPR